MYNEPKKSIRARTRGTHLNPVFFLLILPWAKSPSHDWIWAYSHVKVQLCKNWTETSAPEDHKKLQEDWECAMCQVHGNHRGILPTGGVALGRVCPAAYAAGLLWNTWLQVPGSKLFNQTWRYSTVNSFLPTPREFWPRRIHFHWTCIFADEV